VPGEPQCAGAQTADRACGHFKDEHPAGVGAAAVLLERLTLAALAALVAGHYAAEVLVPVARPVRDLAALADVATMAAVIVIGVVWIRARTGHDTVGTRAGRRIWTGLALLALLVVWGSLSLRRTPVHVGALFALTPAPAWTPWPPFNTVLQIVLGFGLALPAVGGGDALSRAAHDFAPPRLKALRRIALGATLFVFAITVLGTFVFTVLVPPEEWSRWVDLPLVAVAQHVAGPAWIRTALALAVAVAAVLMLSPAVAVALADAEAALHRLTVQTSRFDGLARVHHRFGTPARTIDVTVMAAVAAILACGGRTVVVIEAARVAFDLSGKV